MKPIPLNLMTLYADLAQSMPDGGPEPAAISRRLESGKRRLYASVRDGVARKQIYLGTVADPKAEAAADAHRRAALSAKARRKTVTTLKRAGVPAPDLYLGRLLEVIARAGYFESGAVLIGTAAFQLYAPIVGAAMKSSALITQDADIALARLFIPKMSSRDEVGVVLKRADPSFAPIFRADDKLPKAFRSASGFSVDILTTKGRNAEPLQLRALGCAATPLKFLDYLIEDAVEAVALYGTGVRVRLPLPARYAVHKLIVARERKRHDPKAMKDAEQARELIDALDFRDPSAIDEAIDDARARGRAWKTAVDRGLEAAAISRD